ncbi:MAG TPA: hypothetical protein VHG91_18965 [Longimicrobium sp.]|nr:hypothetical protein [Longimicrobium sp.]
MRMRASRTLALAAAVFAIAGCDDAGKKLLSPGDPLLTVGPTTSVTVACPTKMEKSTTAQCVAFGYDADGVFTTNTAAWSTSTGSLLTVSSGGSVTTTSDGTGQVTATINGASATAPITIATPPPPPTVTILGPSSIRPYNECGWYASVSGGSGAISYAWSQSAGTGTASGHDYLGESATSFTLSVTVTDALARTATATKSVTVTSGAVVCRIP